MSMESDVIKSLKLRLTDLTYILFTIEKEFSLIIQKSDDKKVKEDLSRVVSALRDSNSEVIRLYHAINSNEVGIQNEWYNDETTLKSLKNEVDNLNNSINALVEGNKSLLKQ